MASLDADPSLTVPNVAPGRSVTPRDLLGGGAAAVFDGATLTGTTDAAVMYSGHDTHVATGV